MPMQQMPDGSYVNVPQTGLIGSEQALQGGLMGSLSMMGQGTTAANAALNPYAQGGGQAFNQQMNLSGAAGVPAQQTAFANFNSSPEQAYLRQQGEQALMRNASAMGGIGGGNVRKELVQQGIGIAQQDYQNHWNRLQGLSGMGMQATGQQANNLQRAGEYGGNAFMNTGQALAAGRTRAGEGIANATQNTGSALAALINQQGSGVSDILGQGTGSLASLLQQSGAAQGMSQEQLASILANIATGSGNQYVSSGTLQPNEGTFGNIASGIGALGTGWGAYQGTTV